jgi:hypothetical protein
MLIFVAFGISCVGVILLWSSRGGRQPRWLAYLLGFLGLALVLGAAVILAGIFAYVKEGGL